MNKRDKELIKYRGRWITPFDALRKVLNSPEWSGGELRVAGDELFYCKGTASIRIKKELRGFVEGLGLPWSAGQSLSPGHF